MLEPGSVSHWIQLFKNGDRASAQPLWERYHKRIIGLARTVLQQSSHRHADEEDVAQEAFNSFFLALKEGRYPQLSDRDNLWRLLVIITKRKSIDQIRKTPCFGATQDTAQPVSILAQTDAEFEADFEQLVAELFNWSKSTADLGRRRGRDTRPILRNLVFQWQTGRP